MDLIELIQELNEIEFAVRNDNKEHALDVLHTLNTRVKGVYVKEFGTRATLSSGLPVYIEPEEVSLRTSEKH